MRDHIEIIKFLHILAIKGVYTCYTFVNVNVPSDWKLQVIINNWAGTLYYVLVRINIIL